MKFYFAFLYLIISSLSYGQIINENEEEELVTFNSMLIDYEIHNEQLVAITKKRREYFIYFTDSKGSKLYETFDIFFPTDIEIDCMGNLFVIGLDSAIQIKITDFVTRIQSLDIATYNSTIRSCKAYFKDNLVRSAPQNMLIYEPIDDSKYAENPMIGFIQVVADRNKVVRNPRTPLRTPSVGTILVDNPSNNVKNDMLIGPYPKYSRTTTEKTVVQAIDQPVELIAFQVGDSLWVFDLEHNFLLVYDDSVSCERIQRITGVLGSSDLQQDRYTNEVYTLSVNSRSCEIQKIDRFGSPTEVSTFFRGFKKGDLKISNGYLYYRDSTGMGESINRIKLK